MLCFVIALVVWPALAKADVTATVPIDTSQGFTPIEVTVTLELRDALAQEAAITVAEMAGVAAPTVPGRIWMSVTNAKATDILRALENVGKVAWDFEGLDYVVWYQFVDSADGIDSAENNSDWSLPGDIFDVAYSTGFVDSLIGTKADPRTDDDGADRCPPYYDPTRPCPPPHLHLHLRRSDGTACRVALPATRQAGQFPISLDLKRPPHSLAGVVVVYGL
jgi:hypothetical protein